MSNTNISQQIESLILTQTLANDNALNRKEESSHNSQAVLALIAALQGTLKQVEGSMNSSQPATSSSEASSTQDESQAAYPQVMAQMAALIGELQVLITQCNGNIASYNTQIAQDTVKDLQFHLDDLKKKIKKLEKDAPINHFLHTLEEVLGGILSAVLFIAAVLSGQWVLATMIIVLTTLTMSGAFNKMSDAISKSLQEDGMSQVAANILAKVLVTVMVIVVSAIAAPGSAASEVEEAAEDATSLMSKMSKFFEKINIFNRLGTRANMAISNGFQTAGSVNLAQDLATALIDKIAESHPMSDAEKKKLEAIVGAILSVLFMIAQMGSSSSVMGDLTSVAKEGEGTESLIGAFKSKILNFSIENPTVYTRLMAVRSVVTAGSGLTSMGTGLMNILQGLIEKAIADDEQAMSLDTSALQIIDNSMSSTQKHEASVMSSFVEKDQMLGQLFAGEKAFSNLLTNV